MAQSNHGALGEGLKLYTDAMRRFVKERLIAKYPSNWWENGVLQALTPPEREKIKSDMKRHPSKDRLELIEPGHLVRIITRNFDHAFAGFFNDFKATQSYLNQVAGARNQWAHPKTGDMLADEVGVALYAVGWLLERAKLPEASEVAALRKAVQGIKAEPAPTPPAQPTAAPARGALPHWWEVCEPRDGFQNPNSIDEALFAATLGGVFNNAAPKEFLDAETFLSHTYFTENLKQTIFDVVSRLNKGQGPSVTEMQTPFGGGKTHALLTLYHLIKDPKKALAVPGVREALGDVGIPAKARVLVFDGQELGAEPMMKQDQASVSTIWGELTHQVDPGLFMTLMMDADGRGVAPGNAAFRKVLETASPCLILIDELVSYLVKLRFANDRRTQNLYRQTVQFLQETFQLASTIPGVCILVSLPKGVREFGGLDPEQLRREMSVLDELQPKVDRVVSKRTPVNDAEVYVLMSKRLFKKVDLEAAKRVAQAYRDLYKKTPNSYHPTVLTDEYLRQQVAAYPIHPELIDVLYKKWSTASDFPRTRAVLQLLAVIVADQWVNRRSVYTIQSAHVNLERERIRTRIVSAAGAGGGYAEVVAADIIGGDAHADMDDQRRGAEYAQGNVARGVATTLLMHSFGGQTHPGAATWELRLGTVAPNLGPEYVTEVLTTLQESLWYVHKEGELLRFRPGVNIYRVIAQTAKEQQDSAVAGRLQDELGKAQGSAPGFIVLPWTGINGPIPDRPDPSIAILGPKYAVSSEGKGSVTGREPIDQLWDKSGGGLRQWRNSLILVAPDRELWDRAEDAVREALAYEQVVERAEKKTMELSPGELKDLLARSDGKRQSLRTSLVTAYRWVFYPDEQGLSVLSLPVPATQQERIADRAVKRLSDQDYGTPKILTKLGAIYFNSKIVPRVWKDGAAPLELGELSRRFPQWTYLPILPNREATLRECLREGIGQKLWAAVIGDNATATYQKLIETAEDFDKLGTLFDGSVSLVKGELRELLRKTLGAEAKAPERKPPEGGQPGDGSGGGKIIAPPVIPPPAKRHKKVRLRVEDLKIAKTSNLQPYLFKVLQEQDPGAELTVTIEVDSSAGIPADVLERRIVEGFEQLGITVTWEEG